MGGADATETWPIEELAAKLGVGSELVRKGAGYWVANGALRASFQDHSLVYEVSFGEEINPSGEGTVWGQRLVSSGSEVTYSHDSQLA
jgi:hypothetical protein